MGNNNKKSTNEYISELTEKTVPLDNLTPPEMEYLIREMMSWIIGDRPHIISELSSKEINYLLTHMDTTENNPLVPTGHLLRIESGHHFNESGLNEGDTLTGNELFRSFSRTTDSTNEILEDGFGEGDITIYRTVGNAPFFNPMDYANPIPSQTEVFVPVDTYKIEKINRIPQLGYEEAELLKKQYNLNIPYGYVTSVTVVDISHDPSVKQVTVNPIKDITEDGTPIRNGPLNINIPPLNR